MPTFFLDYDGGNDGNDGTTFANRWKTITSGATTARIAPGDVIRVMGSPAPTSLGINATWTNKSPTVTLASPLNALITNCDSAWTASANVTSTADATIYRTATSSARHAIASGFTTGLASYFATGTLDLSGYQGITLWVYVLVKTLAASELSIRLCSDTVGATPVDTLALPAITQTAQWVPVYIDKGSALGASIQSIALYGDTDNGAITVYLDNISAVKAAGNDALTLQSLIGKNTSNEYWWALRSINGTALTLDASPAMQASIASRGYYGTTESVTTYKRETIKTALVAGQTTVVQAVQDSGTDGNLITFSGGWDRTDMTTQTLETYFDGQSGFGYGLAMSTRSYISLNKLHCVRYYRGIVTDGNNLTIDVISGGHCTQSGIYLNGPATLTANELHVWGCNTTGFENLNGSDWTITKMVAHSPASASVANGWSLSSTAATGHWSIGSLEICNAAWFGLTNGASTFPANVKIGTLTVKDNPQGGWAFGTNTFVSKCEVAVIAASGNGSGATNGGVALAGMAGQLLIGAMTSTGNTGYGLYVGTLAAGADVTIQSLTTSGNTSGGIAYAVLSGRVRILQSSIAEGTKISGSSAAYSGGSLSLHKFNGTADDHRTYLIGGGTGSGLATIFSEGTVRHTASGIAWKLSPLTTTYVTALWPLVMPVATIAVNASALVTVRAFLRRTNTGLTAMLRCRGGQIPGVAADVTASMTAIADTWEELEITFTPSEQGVVQIEVACYGGSTYSLYVDDVTMLQA